MWFPEKPCNKSFIDQVCSVKMAGYWPRDFFFCEFIMVLDFVSVHKHTKKEQGQYLYILTSHLVNNPYIQSAAFFLEISESDWFSHRFPFADRYWSGSRVFSKRKYLYSRLRTTKLWVLCGNPLGCSVNQLDYSPSFYDDERYSANLARYLVTHKKMWALNIKQFSFLLSQ